MDMNNYNLVDFQDIEFLIRPFDLIAFRGGDLVSDTIAKLETQHNGNGCFTHVGMVVTSDVLDVLDKSDKNLYIFESTCSYSIPLVQAGVPDALTGRGALGVQIRKLKDVIPVYIENEKTKISWCSLKNNPYSKKYSDTTDSLNERRNILKKVFSEFFLSYHGRLYEIDLFSLFSSLFSPFRKIRDMKDTAIEKLMVLLGQNPDCAPSGWQFCSELVANAYIKLNIFDSTIDPRNIVPMDFFGSDSKINLPIYIKDWDINGSNKYKYNIEQTY